MSMGNCHFCGAACEVTRQARYNHSCYENCPNCGSYNLYDWRKNTLDDHLHTIAGYLYETNRHIRHDRYGDSPPRDINGDILQEIKMSGLLPRTNMQRLERLLLNVYKLNKFFGQVHTIEDKTVIFGLAYAKSVEEFIAMSRAIKELGWFSDVGNPLIFTLSAKGVEHAEQLLMSNINSRKAFVAMGFKEDLLTACEEAIKPACRDCGFDAFLISDRPHNNGITDEIIVAIRQSRFVIVDFTYNNAGAYFEAGFAQGLGRPIIRCCKKEWFDGKDEKGERNQLHFDIRHYATILWEDHADLIKQLKANIRANIPDARLEDEGGAV